MNELFYIDNKSLVDECKRGDKEALSLLYSRYAPKMLSLVHRYVNSHDDAMDILHDGFIVAFTRLDTLQDPESISIWLGTIMKNLCLQFLRTQDVSKVLDEIPDVSDAPDFSEIIDMDALESIIRKLPMGYQQVFRLSVLENKTHKEISKILGIAPQTSASQLFHAKILMRKLIVEYSHEVGLAMIIGVLLLGGFLIWNTGYGDRAEEDLIAASGNAISKEAESTEVVEIQDIRQPGKIAQAAVISKSAKAPSLIDTEDLNSDMTDDAPEAHETIAENVFTESKPVSGDKKEDEEYGELKPLYDPYSDVPVYKKQGGGWSLSTKISGNLSYFKGNGDNLDSSYGNFGSSVTTTVGPLDDYNVDSLKSQASKMSRSMVERSYKDLPHNSDMPITVAIVASKKLNNLISVETGVAYSYLRTTFESGQSKRAATWHYLGVPVRFAIDNFESNRFRLYATLGAQLDIPLYSRMSSGGGTDFNGYFSGSFNSHVVWSVSASYGVNIRLAKNVGLLIEPSLRYNFSHSYEVPNAWTDNRWSFSLPIGVRLNF